MPNLTPRDRKKEALRRLGVKPSQLETAPPISSYLREMRGGKKVVISALRFCSDPIATTFLETYDNIPDRDREQIPIEAVAIAAGVDVRTLLGVVLLAVREHSASRVKILALSNHPSVYRKRIEYAKTPAGFRDRDAIDMLLGALPSPKGPTFIGKIINNATGEDAEGKEEPEADELADDEGYIFPDPSEIQEKMQRRLGEGK